MQSRKHRGLLVSGANWRAVGWGVGRGLPKYIHTFISPKLLVDSFSPPSPLFGCLGGEVGGGGKGEIAMNARFHCPIVRHLGFSLLLSSCGSGRYSSLK